MAKDLLKSPLPLPEINEELNLCLSFKQPNKRNESFLKRPPKLNPKNDLSFNRSFNSSFANSISFKEGKNRSGLCPIYNRTKHESYYEQCFEQISKIGEGSFGEVFKVKSKEDGCLYAVKKSKEFFRGENYRQERLEEVRRYEQFSEHEHCVTLYKAWEQEERLFMQMELCKGSLEAYAIEQKLIPEMKVWSILLDLLLGLKSLHDRSLIHLDIKLDNILITDEDVCKLADFGLVLDLNRKNLDHATEGDSRYIAPELMQGQFTKAVDIFSLGIAILELSCNLELPSNGPLWQRLRSGHLPNEIVNVLSQELQNIIKWMMDPNPDLRPSVETLLRYPRIHSLFKERNRWRIVRKMNNYIYRKMCNFKYIITNIFLSITSCLRLKQKKPRYRRNNSDPRLSLLQNSDDENESINFNGSMDNVQITPTLNNCVPSHTPVIRIVNSTPLNHNNGLRYSFRHPRPESSFRNLSFESSEDDLSFSSDTNIHESSHRTPNNSLHESFITKKKLFFKADDSD